MSYNFKFYLLKGLVQVNAWELLESIIGGIYEYRLDFTLHKGFLLTLFSAIEWMIEPIYSSLGRKNIPGKTRSEVECPFLEVD
jgi:hypothetical protein